MPRVSEFYGIVIAIFYGDDVQHSAPHFHASYAEFSASLSIPDADVLAGALPRRQLRLVQAWAELRRTELEQAWEEAVNNRPLGKITPL